MNRVYNFSAGPSMLPLEVLERAQKEFVCYGDSGMSVMEMSHRSKVYDAIIKKAEADLKQIMNVPDNYKILFLQGGASTQFAMVPMNLLKDNKDCDYVNTGQWSKKAIAEAKKYGNVNVVASSEDKVFSYVPKLTPDMFNKNAAYCHVTLNNTIYGTHIPNDKVPNFFENVPVVADMSSNILAEEYDINKFGIIYAGAQKNLGPAGLTVAIVREDLVNNPMDITPTMLRYDTHVKADSLYNTPPTYAIYFAGLVFEWILEKGGIKEMQKINERKSKMLYDFLDNSKLFKGTVVKEDRSLMNIPFILPTEELNAKFIKEATENGFVNLKGHRTVGGMRASIYNAMPVEGVEKLIDFMANFEKNN